MSAIEKPSLFTRLRRTTITELLRGRISSGHTAEMVLAESDLDPSVKSLISETCRRTKLWNAERVDVARELVAHFADGRDAGESPEKLIRSFGELRQAATLIRRAKIRNRSLLWHAKRFCLRVAGVLLLAYLGLAIYFATGKPNVKTDYVARLNEPVLKIPENERAWPYYREFGEAMDAEQKSWSKEFSVYPESSPKRWPAVVEWLTTHPRYLELADQATSRPHMGFVFGPNGSVREMKSLADVQQNPDDPMFNSVISVLLPQLTQLRNVANLLAADAKLACEQNDAARWFKRMDQLTILCDHASEPRFLVNDLVSIGIEGVRLRQIEQMLGNRPDLLGDGQLAALAHRSARYSVPADLLSFRAERMGFEDIVQRTYTDNGHGDGYLSARGMSNLQHVTSPNDRGLFPSDGNIAIEATKFVLAPASVVVVASRKELTEKYNALMDKAEARLLQPWRERDKDPIFIEVQNINSSFRQSMKYMLISTLFPSLDRSMITAERLVTRRNAIQVAIALELFRRKAGHYPSTLDELSPGLLPTVPLDPVDGKPMRYKLVDGGPLVYSIGVDFDDDGGTFPVTKVGVAPRKPAPHAYSLAIGESDERFDGDWILYPEPNAPSEDEEADDSPEPTTGPSEME